MQVECRSQVRSWIVAFADHHGRFFLFWQAFSEQGQPLLGRIVPLNPRFTPRASAGGFYSPHAPKDLASAFLEV